MLLFIWLYHSYALYLSGKTTFMNLLKLLKNAFIIWLIIGVVSFNTNGQSTLWGLTNYSYSQRTAGNIFNTNVPLSASANKKFFFTNGIKRLGANIIAADSNKLYGVATQANFNNSWEGNFFEYDLETKGISKIMNFESSPFRLNFQRQLLYAKNKNIYFIDFDNGTLLLRETNFKTQSTSTILSIVGDNFFSITNLVELDTGKLSFVGSTFNNFVNKISYLLFTFSYTTNTFSVDSLFLNVSNVSAYDNLYLSNAKKGYFFAYNDYIDTRETYAIHEVDFSTKTISSSVAVSSDTLLPTPSNAKMIEYMNNTIMGIMFSPILDHNYLYEFHVNTKKYFIRRTNINNGSIQDFNPIVDSDSLPTFNPIDMVFSTTTGKVYGISRSGGTNDNAYLFEYDPFNDILTKKIDLKRELTGSPAASFYSITEKDGIIYGRLGGGRVNNGVLFRYTPLTNQFEKLYEFDYASQGSYPHGSLLYARDSVFYGLAYRGGSIDKGVLFGYNPQTSTYTKKHDFDITLTGANPYGSLIQPTIGNPNQLLYGMASAGGANDMGTLFSYKPTTSGTFTKLFDFSTATGANPYGTPVLGRDGLLYGLTKEGGANGNGTLFSYNITTSSFTKLQDFNALSTGSHPKGSLLSAPDGKLYGITEYGGTEGLGVLFAYNPITNNLTKLFNFTTTTGCNPTGDLIVGGDGLLYGLTAKGGTHGVGVLFSFNTATNVFAKKKDFTTVTGANPMGTLRLASTGKYYGMANRGGANDLGTVFEYDAAKDTLSVITDFDGNNGARPMYGALVDTCYAPRVTREPLSLRTCVGSNVVLSLEVSDTNARYTWFREGSSVSGLNARLLTVVAENMARQYYCRLENECGVAISETVTVSGLALPTLTGITNPVSREVCEGGFFSISVSGTKFVEWYQNGAKVESTTFTGPGGVPIVVPDTIKSIFRFFVRPPLYAYSIIGTDLNLCKASITIPITVNGLPTVTGLATPSSICQNQTTTLLGAGAANYTWKGSIPSPLSSEFSTLTSSISGLYTITVTGSDAKGCKASDTVAVRVNSLPRVEGLGKGKVCVGDTVALKATGAKSYQWQYRTLEFLGTKLKILTNIAGVEVITLTGIDEKGCENKDTIRVETLSLPNVEGRVTKQTLCRGEVVTFSGSGTAGITYNWSDGVVNDGSYEPNREGVQIYSVMGIDVNGCRGSDTVVLKVNAVPTIAIARKEQSICLGEGVVLSASGATQLSWSGGIKNNEIFYPTSKELNSYTVIGIDENKCKSTGVAVVTVNGLPDVAIVSSQREVCPKESIKLTARGGVSYEWVSDKISMEQKGSEYLFSESITGIYLFTVTGRDGNGCSQSDTISVRVRADKEERLELTNSKGTDKIEAFVNEELRIEVWIENPEGEAIAPKKLYYKTEGFTKEQVGMQVEKEQGDNGEEERLRIEWKPKCNDLKSQPTYKLKIWAEVRQCGLYVSDTMVLEIELKERERQLEKLMNVITPNGDGLNEAFYIEGANLERCEDSFRKIEIYNRWGNKVYESSSEGFRWQPNRGHDGLFYYTIQLTGSNYTGTVMVVR